MTEVNKNRYKNHSRNIQRRRLKRQLTIFATSLFIILACCVIFGNLYSLAYDMNSYKDDYYTSITIKQGDTLWSIANEYVSDNDSVQKYVDKIKKINGLKDDNIQSGMKLVVIYDDNQFVGSTK